MMPSTPNFFFSLILFTFFLTLKAATTTSLNDACRLKATQLYVIGVSNADEESVNKVCMNFTNNGI